MNSVDGKGTVFPMKLKLEGNHLKKDIKKENFEKDVIHSIQTNHEINMTFVHSVLSSTSFKKYLNAKSFKIFWEYWSSCAKQDVAGSVSVEMVIPTYKGDRRRNVKRTLIIKQHQQKHHFVIIAINNVCAFPAIIGKNGYKLYSNITCPRQTVKS